MPAWHLWSLSQLQNLFTLRHFGSHHVTSGHIENGRTANGRLLLSICSSRSLEDQGLRRLQSRSVTFLGIESKTQCFVWSIAKQFEKKKYSTQMWTQRLRGEFNTVTVVPQDAPRPASYVTKFTKQQQQQIQNTSKSSKYQQCNECSWAPEEALRPSLGSTGRSVDLGLMLKSAEACNVQKLVEKLWRILKAS